MREYKPFWITMLLGVLVVIVFYMEVGSLFVGPSIAFENKVEDEVKQIQENISTTNEVYRHVFEYIVYTTNDNDTMYWYNDSVELVYKTSLSDVNKEEAKTKAIELGFPEDVTVQIGFGYDKPVYVMENETQYLLLDLKSFDIVYFRKGVSE